MNNRYIIIFIFLTVSLPVYSASPSFFVRPVELSGSALFADLLKRPVMSTVIGGATTIARLNPYIRAGATIASLYMLGNELRPKNGGEIPPGWIAPNHPPEQSPITTVGDYWYTPGEHYSSPSSWCYGNYSHLMTNDRHLTGYVNGACQVAVTSGYYAGSFDYYPYRAEYHPYQTCGPGYVLNNGNCLFNESDPATGVTPWPDQPDHDVFQPDSLGGGLWEKSPRQTATPNPDTTAAGTGVQSQTGLNPSTSQPSQTSVTPLPDGGIKFQHTEQTNDPVTGQTNVTVDSFTTNSYGNITNATTNIFNNTSLQNVVNNSPVIQTNVDVSSLAKDATLQETNSKLDTIKDKLKKDESEFQVIPDVRSIPDSLSLVFDSIKSKFIPPTFADSVSSCPVWSQTIPYLNVPFVIDELCLWEPKLRPIISSVMFAVWALLSIKILLSA